MYIYIFIYIYIYEPRKKLIYKVYTSIHIQFSMGRALPQRKEGQGSDKSLHPCLTAHGSVRASLVFRRRAQRLVIWLLQ